MFGELCAAVGKAARLSGFRTSICAGTRSGSIRRDTEGALHPFISISRRNADAAEYIAGGRETTVTAHMPAKHRHYAGMTASTVQAEAQKVGPNVVTLVEVILRNKPRPEQGIRACVGILKLKRGSGPERLDAACARALALNACSLKSVTSILQNRLEDQPIEVAPDAPTIAHANLRRTKGAPRDKGPPLAGRAKYFH